jgi:hypothetical protein
LVADGPRIVVDSFRQIFCRQIGLSHNNPR